VPRKSSNTNTKAKDRALRARNALRVQEVEEQGCQTTRVTITAEVQAATRDGWLCFWVAGREVTIGPLTPTQAQHLCDDLEYDTLEPEPVTPAP
jgi:hypothetical protein